MALDGLSGVEKTDVSIGNVNVVFDESKASDADVKAAIEKAGYK
jgi:copper chaperone CopZ